MKKKKIIWRNPEVKISLNSALKDLNYHNAGGTLLFKYFENLNESDKIDISNSSDFEKGYFKKLEKDGFIEEITTNHMLYNYLLALTEKGKNFIDKIKARLETRLGVKLGTDFFPENSKTGYIQK